MRQERSFALLDGMPRVTEEHRTARREQILDAAVTTFAVQGFQATGMAEIIAASGLSAGAVYRYFVSKDELIEAIVDRVLGQAAGRFQQLLDEGHAPHPAEAVAAAVDLVTTVAQRGPVDMTRVAVQAWAEALRTPGVAAVVDRAYRTIRGYFAEVARRAQATGQLPPDADPEHVAAGMLSLVLGFLLQRLLLGDVPAAAYAEGVRALLAGAGRARGTAS